MKHIQITDQILTGNLFRENGYDEYASAEKLAALLRSTYRKTAEEDYPGAKISVDIDVQRASGQRRPLNITVTDDTDESFVNFPPTEWYEREVAGLDFDDWAVEAAG